MKAESRRERLNFFFYGAQSKRREREREREREKSEREKAFILGSCFFFTLSYYFSHKKLFFVAGSIFFGFIYERVQTTLVFYRNSLCQEYYL